MGNMRAIGVVFGKLKKHSSGTLLVIEVCRFLDVFSIIASAA